MKDFTRENLTNIVLQEYSVNTSNDRTKTVLGSLIKHLHAFVNEVELSEDEWMSGVDFLTRAGQACDEKRQEYILLSDVLGVSMLVDAINHQRGGKGTESTVLGPFYVEGAPQLPMGASIVKASTGAGEVLVKGIVTDVDGNPVAGAVLDVWQTSSSGFYDVQEETQPDYNMRGRFVTGETGEYSLITEKPCAYSIPTDGPVGELLGAAGRHAMRPAHIHFIVSAKSYSPVTTHLFCASDEYLDSDAVFATKSSLLVDFAECEDETIAQRFDLKSPFTLASYNFKLLRE